MNDAGERETEAATGRDHGAGPFGYSMSPRWALVSGSPGIGKSTAVRTALEHLSTDHLYGFVCDEIRIDGARQGFSITTVGSQASGTLAAPWVESTIRFGTYDRHGVPRLGVDLEFLNHEVVAELEAAINDSHALVVLDELGPMQASSDVFRDVIDRLLTSRPALGSIALYTDPWLELIRESSNVHVLNLTKENRDGAYEHLLGCQDGT